MTPGDIRELNAQARSHAAELLTLRQELKKVIVGQDRVMERPFVALCANGQVLLEGVPGIAKP